LGRPRPRGALALVPAVRAAVARGGDGRRGGARGGRGRAAARAHGRGGVVTGTAAIALVSASKWYDEVLAVDDVSAEFGPGVTGLLGPNGAGKSTMIKLLAGMLAPSLGEVRVLGADPFSTPGIMRQVGLVPEQDPVYPRVSAYELQCYLNRLHGFPAAEAAARARSTLERVGLAGAMDRPVAGYSKGMRQRAKLAQALSH